MLGEEYNACSSALGNFLHSPVISSLLAPNIFLSTLFSNTLNLCSSLKVRDRGLSKGFVTVSFFLRWGVVNPLTNPQAGGPPLRLSATAYSYISQLPSISGGRLPYPQPGDAPCREVRDPQTHVIIHLRKFYRPVCFPRNWKLRHIKLLYYPLYWMVVKLGLSPWERSID